MREHRLHELPCADIDQVYIEMTDGTTYYLTRDAIRFLQTSLRSHSLQCDTHEGPAFRVVELRGTRKLNGSKEKA